MKKTLCLAFAMLLMLSLCACGSSREANAPQGLQVGYGRAEITPKDSVPLAGYGKTSERMSKDVLDYLYATCIAFRQDDQTVLLFSQDLICSRNQWNDLVRQSIETELGIPGGNVMICATHTHSAPDVNSSLPIIATYQGYYTKRMVSAAREAIEDLAPATLYGGSKVVDGMNFVRHYVMSDGSYAGSNFGDFSLLPFQGHASENDPVMLVTKIDRGADKKAIMLLNWAAHPCFTGGSTQYTISSDFIGMTRQKVEKDTGMLFAYFTAAAGNQNTNSRIPEEKHGLTNQTYGEQLAQHAIDLLPELKPLENNGVKLTKVTFESNLNHDDEDKAAIAREVVDYGNTVPVDQANSYARTKGLSSYYQATAILARLSRPQTGTMELNAVEVGGLAFVTAPYEMFADHAVHIRENSPYEMTMVFTCANGVMGYIPSIKAYEYGCYESFTSYFGRGTGEAAAEKFVEMLEGLKSAQ